MVNVEGLLHNLGPYLPTDRFRALVAGKPLPQEQTGAAMFVDISGFTPLAVGLVKEYGAQRASEELKRRLNPMFEAIAGLVFTHGGSVLRFVGDGFTAWFPDFLDHTHLLKRPLPGIIRASVAAVEMLEMMVFFRDLELKVGVQHGIAKRWVVGSEQLGLIDILVGHLAESVAEVTSRCESKQARAARSSQSIFRDYPHLHYKILPDGDLLLERCSAVLVEDSRAHRWGAWQVVDGNAEAVLEDIRPFIDPLIQQQEAAGLGALAGELRYATPVFLRFAGIDYNHDPDALAKLDAYVRDVQQILKETNGRLVSLEVADKGSVIFAVFGAPIAYGDDSRRAVYAALNFRDLPKIHQSITHQQIGASRGLLYSGTVGGEVRHEYTSLGNETNVASRLMSADKTGNILISQAIYDDCHEWFEFEAGETISPKGRVGLVPTYIPIRAKSTVQRNLRKNPLVGREAEYELIKKAFNQAGIGLPRVIRLEGAAGIGKSRIAAEIAHLARGEKRRLAIGQCISTSQSTALAPWRQIMRAVLQVPIDLSVEQEIDYVVTWLRKRQIDWESRLPLLGDLLGIALDETDITINLSGSARQQALFTLVTDILYFEAKQTPLVIIIEDTHWLDEVSENLLVELITRMTAAPVAILLTLVHRPAHETAHPATLLQTLQDNYLQLHIEVGELSLDAIGELLEHHLGGLIPPELATYVFEKAQGNPFFSLEIVDALQQSNVIQQVGPRIYLDDNLEALDIPQTVQGLILARLDKLPEGEKVVLKVAAVIGRTFDMRVLIKSLPIDSDADTVQQYLRNLEQKQFLYLEAMYPHPRYAFRHAIMQEVTYQTLLYDQRHRWHQNVGNVIEDISPTDWEQLAYHFARSLDRDRAYVYLVRAGDHAAEEFANQAALDYWAEALTRARSHQEQFDLLCKRLELLMRLADRSTIETDLEAVIQLADSDPNHTHWQLQRLRYEAEHALNVGDWDAAEQLTVKAIQLGGQYRDLQLSWEVRSLHAQIQAYRGDLEGRRRTLARLRQIATELREPAKGIRLWLSDLLEQGQNNPQDALLQLQTNYPDIVELNDPLLEANYWNVVSRLTLGTRLLSEADRAMRTQLRLWRQVGNRRLEGNTLVNLGRVLYFMGEYSGAGAQFRESYMIASQVNDRWVEANSLVYLGALAFRRAAYGEADAYIDRGIIQLEAHNAPQSDIARANYLRGIIAAMEKRYDDATAPLHHALNIYRRRAEKRSEVEIALAYVHARIGTLPLKEDLEVVAQPLFNLEMQHFHDPDVAFWQVLYLYRILQIDMTALRVAVQQYLTLTLSYLESPSAREVFLAAGYHPQLIETLDLKQF